MKRIILTALLIVTANTVASATISTQHDKNLPTPHDLITKGKILDKTNLVQGTMQYWIAWDKTDDMFFCFFRGTRDKELNSYVACRLAVQQSEQTVD